MSYFWKAKHLMGLFFFLEKGDVTGKLNIATAVGTASVV
jgi:hypothetical protein